MRIGINASFLRKPGTGIGQVTLHFLETLATLSYTENHEFFLYLEEESSLVPTSNSIHQRAFLPRFWKRDDLFRKWLWEQRVATEAKRDGCDVFLSLYQSTTIFRTSSIRHTMIVHDLIPRLFPEYLGNGRQRFFWRATERAIHRAHAVVAVSQSTSNDLIEFGVNREVITVAYPDVAPIFRREVSIDEERRVLEKYHLTPGYIYHGGGLEIRKNTAELLREYAALLAEYKGDNSQIPKLVVSGKIFSESNSLATPVRSLVRDLGITDSVRLLGFVPEADLPVLYKKALFFAYPSRYEGFGLPVLEALAVKTPVLTSDVSSLPEVAGPAALYIDPDLPGSLRSGLKRLIQDESLRLTLRQSAEHEAGHFSWTSFTESVIRQVIHV